LFAQAAFALYFITFALSMPPAKRGQRAQLLAGVNEIFVSPSLEGPASARAAPATRDEDIG
jgi:hypothetical protein